jgi:hypothetical protein
LRSAWSREPNCRSATPSPRHCPAYVELCLGRPIRFEGEESRDRRAGSGHWISPVGSLGCYPSGVVINGLSDHPNNRFALSNPGTCRRAAGCTPLVDAATTHRRHSRWILDRDQRRVAAEPQFRPVRFQLLRHHMPAYQWQLRAAEPSSLRLSVPFLCVGIIAETKEFRANGVSVR